MGRFLQYFSKFGSAKKILLFAKILAKSVGIYHAIMISGKSKISYYLGFIMLLL
jgi:hypothetical protein